MSALLEIKNIETYYDLIYAIRGASLTVEEGSITAIYRRWFGHFAQEVPNLVAAMYILNSTPE